MGFRDLKRQARRDLHKRLQDEVLYVLNDTTPAIWATVRIHDAFNDEGALTGRDVGYAERMEITPRARFVDFKPTSNAIIVTLDMGAWVIGRTYPPHDISIDCEITRLSESQAEQEGLDLALPWCGLTPPER